jgi:hypothetical protein
MAEWDIPGMIDRAKGPKKARSIVEILTGQPGGGGTYSIFKGDKNDPVTPGGVYPESPPMTPMGPSPGEVADQRDQGEARAQQMQEALARWQAAGPKMRAMFHNNFDEYMASAATGRDVLKEFPGGAPSNQ